MKYDAYAIEDFLTEESFVNYCLGTPQEDVLFWKKIIKEQPELKERIDKARTLFFLLAVKVDPVEKQKELNKLKLVIEGMQNIAEPTTELPQRNFIGRTSWISIAAAILLCIGVYALFNKKEYGKEIQPYAAGAKSILLKTAYNERKTLTLSDGTTVTVNGSTELKLDDHYNQEKRVLWLNGEAYFEVAGNKDKPFIVVSGTTTTTALGTSFKINNYNNRAHTLVMLNSGKVSVGELVGQKVVDHVQLSPGEKVEVTPDKFAKSTFNLEEIDNWKNRKLVFSTASLKEIKSILKEIYGIEVRSKNQPKKPISFTGTFVNEGLSEVLNAIGFSNHFTYTIKDDIVTLDFDKK
ncbi:FecR family protein [Pedobacter caeni]|uniref:FecR family protein n=1 Tax=Pedobacter caeni TaxID=288992 RepID=A0A1M5MS71_9SPHI|nr:FecR family protein [Pedobacter caeni]SHG80055.1 FecR family protein [Pedobacter caeni]